LRKVARKLPQLLKVKDSPIATSCSNKSDYPKKHGSVQGGAAISFRIHISAVLERLILIECDEPTRLYGIRERMMSQKSLPECDFEKLAHFACD
jgi:hypothetical protein